MIALLTGANGYIGRRLLPELIEAGHEVICVVRDPSKLRLPNIADDEFRIVVADLEDPESLCRLPREIDAAYYLIHSMERSPDEFRDSERRIVENFNKYIVTTSARQVIYLGGIANDEMLSDHLDSRRETEQLLRRSGVPLTVLRAATIIGEGSTSFEIMRDIVEKHPLLVGPTWLNTRCQPIAIRDTVAYLGSVLMQDKAMNRTFDIGGPEVLTYREMLLGLAEIRNLQRSVVTTPLFSPWLAARWLGLITSYSKPLVTTLVMSLKNEVVCKHGGIEEINPRNCMPYRQALERTFARIAQSRAVTNWPEAVYRGEIPPAYRSYVVAPSYGCMTDVRQAPLRCSVEQALDNIWRIGGKRGWYYANWVWQIRGWIDTLVGGVGLRRGRLSETNLSASDPLDFWRVMIADRDEKRLLLHAEMKVPGDAWLELKIEQSEGRWFLKQTATFRPRGILGRLYWYVLYPIHMVMFTGMVKRIARYGIDRSA